MLAVVVTRRVLFAATCPVTPILGVSIDAIPSCCSLRHHLSVSDTTTSSPLLQHVITSSAVALSRPPSPIVCCHNCCLPPSSSPQPRLVCRHLLSAVASHQEPPPPLNSPSSLLHFSVAASCQPSTQSASPLSSFTVCRHNSKEGDPLASK